jgi:hypothetical protein
MADQGNGIERKWTQFTRRLWSASEASRWYGIDFNDSGTQAILRLSGFDGDLRSLLDQPDKEIFDRNQLEKYCQRVELVPLSIAAAQLAIKLNQFTTLLEKIPDMEGFLVVSNPWASKSFVHRNFLRDFHKGFPNLRRTVFSNYPAYINSIHRELRNTLGMEIDMTKDKTSEKLGELPNPGYEIDCLTDEPVAMNHIILLDTRKPIQLRPDVCSWITYARNSAYLKDKAISLPPSLLPSIIHDLAQ